MPVRMQDIEIYGSAVMPDSDATQNIGGAVDTSKRIGFKDLSASGNIQVVSDAAGDTTQTVTVSALNAAGVTISETKTLNGTTVVPMTTNTTWKDLLKAVKSATCAGTVAVEAVTAERSNTAQGGSASSITLDAGASASDDAYNSMVVRITGGTGAGQIRRIYDYVGSTKVATVARDWATPPDNTSVFKISCGMVFEKSPHEVMEVRRLFYAAEADAAGGSSRAYYDKFFLYNLHGSLSLTNAQVQELTDALGVFDFALEASLSGTDTNGAGNNRQVAPGGYTFNSSSKNVANSQNHTAGAGQGVWAKLTLAAGTAANDVEWSIRETGSTAA